MCQKSENTTMKSKLPLIVHYSDVVFLLETQLCVQDPHPSVTMKSTVTSLLSLFPAHSALTTLQTPELCDLQIALQSQK